MYNIKKAVSRLDFAPKIDEIAITDIKAGIGMFTPKRGKPVSITALKATLKKAGYSLASAEITVHGSLAKDVAGYWIESDIAKQRFELAGAGVNQLLKEVDAGTFIEVIGDWQTIGQKSDAREVVYPHSARKLSDSKTPTGPKVEKQAARHEGIHVSVGPTASGSEMSFAPIRTTSPGLTVYKGGAVTPRYVFVRQNLGALEVSRHSLRLGVSYTPTPTLQLEVDVPYHRTFFDNESQSGSGDGLGNITIWGKHRFYRELETWGDRQAAFRLGMELPTGEDNPPSADQLDAPEFVREQLSASNGGLAFHTDVSYSQARRRFIYGANIETTLRGERDGFRTGHELRVNTDLEYVLLPLSYQSPGKELFVILETTYAYRNRGRIAGKTVPGSSSSEFYLAPGLQFTATPRLVLEASYQFPVVMNAGPLVLRTDRNFLVGIRYLY